MLYDTNQGCAIVETGARYQYQYLKPLGCNTNIYINNKKSGFSTSIPISILVQLIQQYQYWYRNHFLQICNININNNIKSQTLAIPITPQYHLILQYLGININIWFNNSTIKCLLGVNFTHSNAKHNLQYQYQKNYHPILLCNTNINIDTCWLDLAISIPIMIMENILLQCQYQFQ